MLKLINLFNCNFFKIPEDKENFTIKLLNATGGARLGNTVIATLCINKNDDPIYFSGKDSTIYEASSDKR